jgi:hypothetical protein
VTSSPLEVVVGLSLKNLRPRVWDPDDPLHVPGVRAVMVSYADFDHRAAWRRGAMERGLHAYLGVPDGVRVYLDNGAFALFRRGLEIPRADYEAFVEAARPDWYPVPRDYIPAPGMTAWRQGRHRNLTVAENAAYRHDGYAPVVHVGPHLGRYVEALQADPRLAAKPSVAIGGLVPNLLRAPKALPYRDVLDALWRTRLTLDAQHLHLFGVGGTATLHLAALLRMDSADSSGWRNRAARGIVQLPGRGDRLVAELGSWRGRRPSDDEWDALRACPCPACRAHGLDGLRAGKVAGFARRAAHNLHVLLAEAADVAAHLAGGLGAYRDWYPTHIHNRVYEPLIEHVVTLRSGDRA